MSWDYIREMIASVRRRDKTWLSNRRSILRIIQSAEVLHIDPALAEPISLSNWTVIIWSANQAIAEGDRLRLIGIFFEAAHKPNADLRILVARAPRPSISAILEARGRVRLEVSQAQFNRIERATRSSFQYAVVPPAEM